VTLDPIAELEDLPSALDPDQCIRAVALREAVRLGIVAYAGVKRFMAGPEQIIADARRFEAYVRGGEDAP
jgi:hypothetical protein